MSCSRRKFNTLFASRFTSVSVIPEWRSTVSLFLSLFLSFIFIKSSSVVIVSRVLRVIARSHFLSEALGVRKLLLLLLFFLFSSSSWSVFFSSVFSSNLLSHFLSFATIVVASTSAVVLHIIIFWSESLSVLDIIRCSKWRVLSVLALGLVSRTDLTCSLNILLHLCSFDLCSFSRFSVREIPSILNSALNFKLTSSDNIINFASDLFYLSFSIKPFSHLIICLNKAFELFLQAVILIVKISHMFIKCSNFSLEFNLIRVHLLRVWLKSVYFIGNRLFICFGFLKDDTELLVSKLIFFALDILILVGFE